MKGIIIYENDLRAINAVKLKNASFCYESIEDDKTDTLQGRPVICASTTCNKEDAYDFETGALIALMKMCGQEKVTKACEELYRDKKYKNKLQETTDCLNDLSKRYDEVVRYCDSLREANKGLQEENKDLKKNIDELFESEQHSKSELGRLYFEKHRLEEKVEKLQHEYDLCLNSENALKITTQMQNKSIEKLTKAIDGYKNDLYKVSKRCTELEAKEAILNKQEETINKKEEELSVYFGGRQNGKQYTFLVDLFKKIDQKKVDAAYKEAYNTTLPVWQKEVLKQMYEVRKIEASKHSLPHVHEWYYRIPTKRDEMWENILGASKCPPVEIKVAKEDITSFLRELQDKIPEVMWNGSDCSPLEYTNPYWFKHDYIYFALFRFDVIGKLRICYDEKPHSWINKPVIEYIAPMRWDLFKKGRIVVKVDEDNYEDFYNKCEIEIGRKPLKACEGTFTVYYEKGAFHRRPYNDTIPYAKKVVYWEDVR